MYNHVYTHSLPVEMVEYGDQEVLIELKGIRELLSHLPDTVYELDKHGSSLIVAMVLVSMLGQCVESAEI